MEEGWRHGDYPRVRLNNEVNWDKYPDIDRSFAFQLQAWNFVDSFFMNGRCPNIEETEFLLTVVRDWNEARLGRARTGESDSSMAYYDMALALRVPRLLAIIWAADRNIETRGDVVWLVELVLHERQALRENWAFAPHSNHGFYTASAQLHLEKSLPKLADHVQVHSQATRRMNLLISSQFADDGGHLEHSPAYQRLLLESFITVVEQGLIVDPEMVERLRRAQHVVGWMIQPDGQLVSIGDTEPVMQAVGIATREATTQWLITDGEVGEPGRSELLVLPESGYVFVRSPQPRSLGERIFSSYLAFQGGFHSRAHKHADDLSFVWFDQGQEILIDAGRWGYGPLLRDDSPLRKEGFYYAAAERQYIESVWAHNTVEIGDKIHDRRRKPYGSGVIRAEQRNDHFMISARAPHTGYTHERDLDLLPGERLVVNDTIISGTEERLGASAWFLLEGSLELLSHGEDKIKFRLRNDKIFEMTSSGLIQPPVRGQSDPLVGWRSVESYELVPAWSIRVTTDFQNTGTLMTKFEFSD